MSDGDRAQSEFNMAVSYLNRLNAEFYAAAEAANELNTHGWFHMLMTLERELSTEMKPKELETFATTRKAINELLDKNTQRNARSGRTEVIPELYEALHAYELELRRVLAEAGLQNKILTDAARALK